MTTNWSFFTWIIGHDSMCVYQICMKLGTENRLWTSLKCAKFQHNRIMYLHFMTVFVKRAKRRKIWSLITQEWLTRFRSNVECGLLYLVGPFTVKIISFGEETTELRMPVNNTWVWHASFLGCRHTTVCLDAHWKSLWCQVVLSWELRILNI